MCHCSAFRPVFAIALPGKLPTSSDAEDAFSDSGVGAWFYRYPGKGAQLINSMKTGLFPRKHAIFVPPLEKPGQSGPDRTDNQPLTLRRARISYLFLPIAGVAELVDALDLGSSAARRGGSSPSTRTEMVGGWRDEKFIPP